MKTILDIFYNNTILFILTSFIIGFLIGFIFGSIHN
jgi:hypothetical protein